jgi:hypothetical protein
MSIVRALSLRQPWGGAVVHGGKRVENRVKWKSSSFRGLILIHAAAGMTQREYDEAVGFMSERGLSWRPPIELRRGGFIGRAVVTGTISTQDDLDAYIAEDPEHRAGQQAWWMGRFALTLDHVEPLPFVPWSGALGFFRVDTEAVIASLPEGEAREAWEADFI